MKSHSPNHPVVTLVPVVAVAAPVPCVTRALVPPRASYSLLKFPILSYNIL